MLTRTACVRAALWRSLATVALIGLVGALLCGPAAAAQAPKKSKPPAAAKPGPAAKPGAKPPVKVPEPEPEEAAGKEDNYTHLPSDESLKKSRIEVTKALRAGKYEGDQKTTLQSYYVKYALPIWTQQDSYNLLPRLRNDLRTELRAGAAGEPHADAVGLVLKFMTQAAGAAAKCHPAVRCNAMLMIGELNEQESSSPTARPTPLPEAVPAMLAALTDANQIDAVRVAALVGLTRHARLGMASDDEQHRQKLVAALVPALVQLVGTKTPPADRSADGHDWMRCQALEILGVLGVAGANGQVAKAIHAVAADKKEAMFVRMFAARALGYLNYTGVSGLDASAMGEAIAQLAMDACGRELPATPGEEVVISRRHLRAALHAAWLGLNGVDEQLKGLRGLAEGTAHKAHVDELGNVIKTLNEAFDKKGADKKEIGDKELAEELRKGVTALALMLKATAPEPAADAGKKPAPAAPSADETGKPAAEAAKPAAGETKPAPETAKPAADDTKPAAAEPKPAAGTAKPAADPGTTPAPGGAKPAPGDK